MAFGNKHLLRRATQAVEKSLEPGEQIEVIVYAWDVHFSLEAVFIPGSLGHTKTFLLSLTNRRVIVHKGDDINLARSEFLGAMPRERVTIAETRGRRNPTSLTVRFDSDEGHRFTIPLVWRANAARFVVGLAPER